MNKPKYIEGIWNGDIKLKYGINKILNLILDLVIYFLLI